MGWFIPLILAAAGTATSEYAAVDEKNKMNAVTEDELQRQQTLQKKATDTFQQSLVKDTAPAFQADQQAGEQKALQQYKQLQQVPLTLGQDKTSPASSIVNDQNQTARANMSNAAAAPLFGYNNALTQMGNNQMLTGTNLGLISNEAQRSQSVLPLELQSASQADAGLSGIGSLLGTAGKLWGMYNTFNPAPLTGQAAINAGNMANTNWMQGLDWSNLGQMPQVYTPGMNLEPFAFGQP